MVSARVQARETLIEIARAVGAPYFHFILTDLQRALKRGYQLHVLGHTLHALLAAVQTQARGRMEAIIATEKSSGYANHDSFFESSDQTFSGRFFSDSFYCVSNKCEHFV